MDLNNSLLKKYFPHLKSKQVDQFLKLKELYFLWNTKVNIISRKDISNIFLNHVIHSLSLSKFICFNDSSNIMDLGCGGGFPGIPLAILFPNVNFILVDSIKKKIKVVNDISSRLGLSNVTTINNRVEKIKSKFDFIVCRAVAPMEKLISWTLNNYQNENKHKIKNGIILLKGGEISYEVEKFQDKIIIKSISDFYEEEYFKEKKIIYYPMNN
ncbi:MAG: 16S rRNA (guanine(527)-N(7))-methyltransferase RsmG [Flavobacteriales bacterium TMED288]|nr:16S rRNA (guanine(527)-N(7))-methyltransferase RsmG [Flavobacteriales bacterium]RPG53657.1 MAG: 16S rRNA (guanine(527)-N(7))-methyltransferase RsmG [Flavobacteriales bacterium TMED288]|tara:strand:+ start:1038 stop:1676 length:639 start_codon:yes stop_codon:yes gene_type:complete